MGPGGPKNPQISLASVVKKNQSVTGNSSYQLKKVQAHIEQNKIVRDFQLSNVEILFLPPNTTSRIQPMDAGIIASYQKYYLSLQLRLALDLDIIGKKDT